MDQNESFVCLYVFWIEKNVLTVLPRANTTLSRPKIQLEMSETVPSMLCLLMSLFFSVFQMDK